MTLDKDAFLAHLQAHLNMTDDEAAYLPSTLLTGILAAATAHTEAQLGFKLNDVTEFPDGTPDDVNHAVLMLAAHWFDQREATTVVTMIPAPFGFDEIIRNHRRWTFG